MGSILAFPLAMPLGGVAVNNVVAYPIGKDLWIAEWEGVTALPNRSYAIAVDGRLYSTVSDREFEFIRNNRDETPIVEVIQRPIEYSDPGFFTPGYFTTPQANKIKLTWNPPASVTDVAKYRIYWNAGSGAVLFTDANNIGEVFENGASSYEFFTVELSAGTYKFVIRTVDGVGNESPDVAEFTQVLTTFPSIVTSQALSFNSGPVTATLTWTDPADISGGNVRIFQNAAGKFFPDYSTPIATIAAGVQTHTTGALADGLHIFGFRVFNGTLEEPNTAVLVAIRLESGAEISGYPPKPLLNAIVTDSGKIRLRGSVDPNLGLGKATQVQFFTNDGAGGAIDFGTPLGSGFQALLRSGTLHAAEITVGPFGETARKFGLRAYTAGFVVSVNSDEVTVTPDNTDPPSPLSVATTTGRN